MLRGNYVIYSRCSTEEQKKSGFSHEYQISGIQECMKAYTDCDHIGTYSDTITGTTFERPELNALLKFCKSNPGTVSLVLVQKWDRFGRNTEECLRWVRLFREIGVEVNSPFEQIDFSSTDYGLILSLRFAMAEAESNKISERTRDGLNQANREGYFTGTAPFGYKRIESPSRTSSGKKRKLLVPDENAGYVREMFRRFRDGEDRGELYHEYRAKICLSKTQFYAVFRNPIYAGFIDVNKYRDFPAERIKGKHEAIIDEDVFESVQELIRKLEATNKGARWTTGEGRDEFYLKGNLICDVSGKSMTGSYSKGRSKRYPYYQTVSGKNRQSYPKDTAHHIVDEAIQELAIDFTEEDVLTVKKMIDDMIKPQTEILRSLKTKEQTTNSRINRIEEDYLNANLQAADYKRLNNKLLTEKARLTREIANLERQIQTVPKVDLNMLRSLCTIPQIYSNGDFSLKRQLLKAIFPEKFSIDPKERRVRTTYINKILYTSDSKLDKYKSIEIKNGRAESTRPVRGGRPVSNRRPSEPQSDALTN
jgi:site-specific DNA recombinase